MKISNYMNNTNSIMEKNTDKVQKGNSQTNKKHTVGQSVKLSISNEGLEYYRNRIQPVSYTHLDVYKRQKESCSPRCCGSSRDEEVGAWVRRTYPYRCV